MGEYHSDGAVSLATVFAAVPLLISGVTTNADMATNAAVAEHGVTSRVSVSSNARQANRSSDEPMISAHGRFIAFTSTASNLVADDTNGMEDVFVRDRRTGITRRVSVGRGGSQANGASYDAAISANGRFVEFVSAASNLVAKDTNGTFDVFVRDRVANTTRRMSVGRGGVQANASSFDRWVRSASISADGRYVAFVSKASNLTAGDSNGKFDLFVRDRMARVTRCLSVGQRGATANGPSFQPVLSAHGRYVAFASYASNLVPADRNRTSDVFVRDQVTHRTHRVSVGDGHAQSRGGYSFAPAISANGRYVAFSSDATNLVRGDTNQYTDVFLRDRALHVTRRLSVGTRHRQGNGYSQGETLSANGRYVAFDSWASNLVANDTNGQETVDEFVRDRLTHVTRRVSIGTHGTQGNSSSDSVAISGDGRHVAFESFASNLVPGDTNGRMDVFTRDLRRQSP
jgi:Tol biopolymer transport system component